VIRTCVGYAGGATTSPTYERIGDHSESIEIDYDPAVLSYEDLLAEFFAGHDARAHSFSTQYRSAIFYRTNAEWAAAERALEKQESVRGRLHTSVEPLPRFWKAEDYHQKFYWKQFTQEWERQASGKAPDQRSAEFGEWLSARGVSGCSILRRTGTR